MGRFFDRFRRRTVPNDAETADEMGLLAESFMTGSGANGEPFGWEPTEASRLDRICDRFLAAGPPADQRDALTQRMGAYLGELLVRHGGGRWAFDTTTNAAAVDLPHGHRAHPLGKVAERLNEGAEHSLFQFYLQMIAASNAPH